MKFKFKNLLGAPYRGGNVVMINNTLVSPIGNRLSINHLPPGSGTTTLPCQFSSNIRCIAASPNGVFVLAIDDNNRCQFINLVTRVVLHRITFKHSVCAAKFSSDGKFIAVGAGKLVQIWRAPGFDKVVFPFQLVRTFADCNGNVTSIDWSPDDEYLLVGCKDLAVRLFCLKKGGSNKSFLFLGHRDVIVAAFFAVERKLNRVCRVYTLSRDGAIFTWGFREGKGEEGGGRGRKRRKGLDGKDCNLEGEVLLNKVKWELVKKDYLMQAPAKLTTCDYHRGLDMIVVGLSNGVFGLYRMPEFVCIHNLTISREKITTAVFNDRGNWLTLGSAKLGQLLVWDWGPESYIMKQQGHYFDVNCIDFSPDSQFIATGADDNKIKLWTVSSGLCHVTFAEHTNAVTALRFTANKHCLLSASLDGTVRAWDCIRYRNFRTFTTPTSQQFVSLATDQSGELICAGTLDSFEIYVWSMKTGKLEDVLSGHEGPVHGLTFSPTNDVLASSSWDKTVRLWNLYEGKGVVESFPHTHDVLTVVYRPDGKQLASSTLDGQIYFWDPVEGSLMYTIEGRRDIAGGRLMTDRRSAANSTSGKCFTTLCYSADGSYILAGGNSKVICMYDVADQVLLHRFQITHNVSLDGVLDFLNSKNMTEAGPLDLIDDDNSDTEEGVDKQTRKKLAYDLPGSMPNHGRPVIRTKCLRIAPTGRSWAAATTEGVLIHSMDESFVFDPTDLDIDVTPKAVKLALEEYLPKRALHLSLRLNEDSLIKKCIISVKPEDVPAVASAVPSRYCQRLLEALTDLMANSPHIEFLLRWCMEFGKYHGSTIQQNSRNLSTAINSLLQACVSRQDEIANSSTLKYRLQYACRKKL